MGFQNEWIFPDLLGDGFLAILLGNGMTSGAIVAVAMMVFLEVTAPRRRKLQVKMDHETLPKLGDFLREFATRAGWNAASAERLVLGGGGDAAQHVGGRGRPGASERTPTGGDGALRGP